MKTHAVKASEIERKWYVVDADNQILGRLASDIAQILRGKHTPIYSPHLDTGDYVVVINAERIKVTGSKETDKKYYRHSGYPGALKTRSLMDMRAKFPERIIERAVRGMLPHNALGHHMYRKLRVYAGSTHPHMTNHPETLALKSDRRAAATASA
jgi:large subunit ribosomal protein L13